MVFSAINYISCLNEIRNGELVYEKNIGWIDLGHSLPDGARELLNADTVYNYQQFMSIRFMNKKITFGSEMKVDLDTFDGTREEVSFFVFQRVSNHFEELQGKMPFYWMDLPYSSSFSEGNISGNVVSFFCALNNIDLDILTSKLALVSTEAAQDLFLSQTNFRKREWEIELIDDYLSSILNIDSCVGLCSLQKMKYDYMDEQLPNPTFFYYCDGIFD